MPAKPISYPKEHLNQAEIDLTALIHNYRLVRDFNGGRSIMAVVKGDAYGHGMKECAAALSREGADDFGVEFAEEGAALRKAGLTKARIFVLSGLSFPYQIRLAHEHDLTVFVYSREQLMNIVSLSQISNFVIKVMLKIDTGMGRLGVPFRDAENFMQLACNSSGVKVIGVATHLASISDSEAAAQLNIFQFIQKKALELFRPPLLFSALSGGALLAQTGYSDGLPRVGLLLYGQAPPKDQLAAAAVLPFLDTREAALMAVASKDKTREAVSLIPGSVGELTAKLKPAMRVTSTVIQVKQLRKNDPVSYEHTWRAPKNMAAAVVPFGYVNGLNFSRSDRCCALIRGRKAPQIGRICMNLSVFDADAIQGVRAGDEAVFLGSSGDEALDAYQEFGGEILNPYETLCLYGRLNPRIWRGQALLRG